MTRHRVANDVRLKASAEAGAIGDWVTWDGGREEVVNVLERERTEEMRLDGCCRLRKGKKKMRGVVVAKR